MILTAAAALLVVVGGIWLVSSLRNASRAPQTGDRSASLSFPTSDPAVPAHEGSVSGTDAGAVLPADEAAGGTDAGAALPADEAAAGSTDAAAGLPADEAAADGTDAGAVLPADVSADGTDAAAGLPADEAAADGTDTGAVPPANEDAADGTDAAAGLSETDAGTPEGGPDGAAPAEAQAEAAAPEPTAEPAPEIMATPEPMYLHLQADPIDAADPGQSVWKYRPELYVKGRSVKSYQREEPIIFGDREEYTRLEGVVTFRGSNMRHNASYGTAKLEQTGFKVLWKNKIGAIDSGYTTWTGVGWNGQPVMVRWPEQLRRVMNLKPEFKDKDGLIEVIYGTLDGNIYFLDAESGEYTRDPIKLGYPIKGSVSIDPRGYPLLFVGQGISKANGHTGKIGWHIYSLLDQERLYFLNGHDKLCYRRHGSFDGVCLLDPETDTVIEGGENGIFYTIKLNTRFDINGPSISVDPEVTSYRYKSALSKELGFENSVAAYGQYAWLVDNSGLLTCFDLNTMKAVWLFSVGDDTDSTIALEPEEDGTLALYTANEVDKQGSSGKSTVRRIDAMTGDEQWSFSVKCKSDGTNGGGAFASPAVGANAYSPYIYYNICRTEGGGTLYCFNKKTGEIVWSRSTERYSWSSPVLVYREDGTGVLVVGNSKGVLRMYDPENGDKVGEIELDGNMEGSPAVFGDILVIGTRSRKIYGVRLL